MSLEKRKEDRKLLKQKRRKDKEKKEKEDAQVMSKISLRQIRNMKKGK